MVTGLERRLLAFGLICDLLALLLLAPGWLPALVGTAEARGRDSFGTVIVGAAPARVYRAVSASAWPQQRDNWCGVATVAAIARFRGYAVSQSQVAAYLDNRASISEWGTPSRIRWWPGFPADIARDGGTDPRSLAAGLDEAARGSYHQLVDVRGAWNATVHLAADLERAREPISVIVLHGLHSVLVSAVIATGDPATHPGGIVGVQVWDPGVNSASGQIQATLETDVPIGQWLDGWMYWGDPYNQNVIAGVPDDPDPAVGPFAYTPAHGLSRHLWIGNYVYLRPDDLTTVNADWPYNQDGSLIAGFAHGELPQSPATPTPSPAPTAPATANPVVAPPPAPPPAPSPPQKVGPAITWVGIASGAALLLLFMALTTWALLRDITPNEDRPDDPAARPEGEIHNGVSGGRDSQ
jgi:hypothetical protein